MLGDGGLFGQKRVVMQNIYNLEVNRLDGMAILTGL